MILEAEGFGFFEVEVGDLDAEVAALDFAVIEEVINDVEGHVDGDGEADAAVHACA